MKHNKVIIFFNPEFIATHINQVLHDGEVSFDECLKNVNNDDLHIYGLDIDETPNIGELIFLDSEFLNLSSCSKILENRSIANSLKTFVTDKVFEVVGKSVSTLSDKVYINVVLHSGKKWYVRKN